MDDFTCLTEGLITPAAAQNIKGVKRSGAPAVGATIVYLAIKGQVGFADRNLYLTSAGHTLLRTGSVTVDPLWEIIPSALFDKTPLRDWLRMSNLKKSQARLPSGATDRVLGWLRGNQYLMRTKKPNLSEWLGVPSFIAAIITLAMAIDKMPPFGLPRAVFWAVTTCLVLLGLYVLYWPNDKTADNGKEILHAAQKLRSADPVNRIDLLPWVILCCNKATVLQWLAAIDAPGDWWQGTLSHWKSDLMDIVRKVDEAFEPAPVPYNGATGAGATGGC